MLNQIGSLQIPAQWRQLLLILLFFIVAWILHRLARSLTGRFLRLGRFAKGHRQPSAPRIETLKGLTAGIISFIAFTVATLASIALFVDVETLVWTVSLFSAAFGLGARPLVSDFLSGMSFVFENAFDVGEKVELSGLPGGRAVEGVVEAVHLRTTLVRAVTGEPYLVPNGEIRVVRNYSRGRFSVADIKINISSTSLNTTLPLLESLGTEAVALLPNLIEPWQVISETGAIGQTVELTLLAKARFGTAAEMRPRLLALVQERLGQIGVSLGG